MAKISSLSMEESKIYEPSDHSLKVIFLLKETFECNLPSFLKDLSERFANKQLMRAEFF